MLTKLVQPINGTTQMVQNNSNLNAVRVMFWYICLYNAIK